MMKGYYGGSLLASFGAGLGFWFLLLLKPYASVPVSTADPCINGTSFLVKNPAIVAACSTAGPNSTTTCAEALGGAHLVFRTNEQLPFIYLDDTGMNYVGAFIDILDEVASAVGFSYEMGPSCAGNYDGSCHDVAEGRADLFWASHFVNSARSSYIQFLNSFTDSGLRLATTSVTAHEKNAFTRWLEPFDYSVWILLLVMMLLNGVLLYIFEHGRNHDFRRKRLSFYWSFLSLSQGGGPSEILTEAGRIVFSGWCFFVLLIVSTYTANLASFLVVDKTTTGAVSSVDDVIAMGGSICVEHSAADTRWLTMNYPDLTLKYYDTDSESVDAVPLGECTAATVEDIASDVYAKEKCGIVIAGSLFMRVNIAGGIPQGYSELAAVFNTQITSMREKEVINAAIERHLQLVHDLCKGASNAESISSSEGSAASLEDLSGLFLVYGVFVGAGFLWFFGRKLAIHHGRGTSGTEDVTHTFTIKDLFRPSKAHAQLPEGQNGKNDDNNSDDEPRNSVVVLSGGSYSAQLRPSLLQQAKDDVRDTGVQEEGASAGFHIMPKTNEQRSVVSWDDQEHSTRQQAAYYNQHGAGAVARADDVISALHHQTRAGGATAGAGVKDYEEAFRIVQGLFTAAMRSQQQHAGSKMQQGESKHHQDHHGGGAHDIDHGAGNGHPRRTTTTTEQENGTHSSSESNDTLFATVPLSYTREHDNGSGVRAGTFSAPEGGGGGGGGGGGQGEEAAGAARLLPSSPSLSVGTSSSFASPTHFARIRVDNV